jgi:hypothetical protein
MKNKSEKSSPGGPATEPLVIDERARDDIREIALGMFMGRNYSQHQTFCREECLFSALKVYLEQRGVSCGWEVANDF